MALLLAIGKNTNILTGGFMYRFLLLILLSFGISFTALPQSVPDTTETEDEWDDWDEWEDNDDWEVNFEKDFIDFKGAPTISVNYGLAKLEHNNFTGSFAEPRSFQLRLGYTNSDKTWQNSNISKNRFTYLSVSNITTDLSEIGENDPAFETNSWRIGLGKSSGYGYDFGQSALLFLSGSSIEWTRLKMNELPADSLNRNITDLFDNTFRFGTSFDAAVRFQIIKQLSLVAGYERAAVFPRHLFWKWAGSALIENAAQFMIDQFVEEILDSSPYFAPVMGFLLKNGLNYGLYELREEKMNWPFNSSAPLMYDQFKFGVTFVL
jgi:hypothetical protein